MAIATNDTCSNYCPLLLSRRQTCVWGIDITGKRGAFEAFNWAMTSLLLLASLLVLKGGDHSMLVVVLLAFCTAAVWEMRVFPRVRVSISDRTVVSADPIPVVVRSIVFWACGLCFIEFAGRVDALSGLQPLLGALMVVSALGLTVTLCRALLVATRVAAF